MFSIIAEQSNIQQIITAVHARGDIVLYSESSDSLNVIYDLDAACELASKYMIIDVMLISDVDIFLEKIKQIQLNRPRMQFVIYAVDIEESNRTISKIIKSGITKICFVNSDDTQDDINNELNNIILNALAPEELEKWNTNKKSTFSDIAEILTPQLEIEETFIEKDVIVKTTLVGTITIGVTGTIHRVGTTHYSIMLANYLQNKGFKTALVEFNQSHAFNDIYNSYVLERSSDESFCINNIRLFPNGADMVNVMSYDFDYIVYDMGVYEECNLQEFQRTNKQIVISGAKAWELSALESILKTDTIKHRYKYIFNFASDKEFEFISENMSVLTVLKGVYCPALFEPLTLEAVYFIHAVVSDMLPSELQNLDKPRSKFNNVLANFIKKER